MVFMNSGVQQTVDLSRTRIAALTLVEALSAWPPNYNFQSTVITRSLAVVHTGIPSFPRDWRQCISDDRKIYAEAKDHAHGDIE